ncbi:MAG: hypothetical protein GX786_09405, partial [Clostridiales bacterium]|nr:hypothetical protein [Clostridiales bacterium]
LTQGITKNKIVSYRVFASRNTGSQLMEETVDGFQFSDLKYQETGKKQLFDPSTVVPNEKAYDTIPFAFTNLPAGVTVLFYAQSGVALQQPPINAGQYQAVFQIGEDHPDYIGGTYEKQITISKGDNPIQVAVYKTTYGEKMSLEVTENLGGEYTVYYRGVEETIYKSTTPPEMAGTYEAIIKVEEGANVVAKEVIFPFTIFPKKIYIFPEENLFKFEGEEDPEEFFFTFEGTIEGEEWVLKGVLTREEGEEAGSYPYDVSLLYANNNYEIVLARDAGEFTILPDEGWDEEDMDFDGEGVVIDPIYPVHQKIKLQNGKKLDIILNTTKTLRINGEKYVKLIWDTQDDKARYFSPSFRINKDATMVLLHLETEPELHEDGGYITDFNGKKIYRGRRLQLSFSMVNKLKRLGITHVSLGVKDASVLFSLEDLTNEQVHDLATQNHYALSRVRFDFTILPETEEETIRETEQKILQNFDTVGEVYRLKVEMFLSEDLRFDIAPMLTQMQYQVGMEKVIKILNQREAEKEQERQKEGATVSPVPSPTAVSTPTPSDQENTKENKATQKETIVVLPSPFDIMVVNAQEELTKDKTVFIEPYMPVEEELPFKGLRKTQRYVKVPTAQSGVYFTTLAHLEGIIKK